MLDKRTVVNTVERYADAVKKEFSPNAIIRLAHTQGEIQTTTAILT
jgi:hypothetical protein